MAIAKSLSSSAVLLLLITALAAQTMVVRSQDCAAQLTRLNSCTLFVVPGSNAIPNQECCAALSSVDHSCLCNTLRIASQIPAKCQLPQLTCAP